MSILLLFGKGEAGVLSLTDERGKAPLLAQVPFSFDWALENLLVYIKHKQGPLDPTRGGRGGKLGDTSGAAFASNGASGGRKELGRTCPMLGNGVSAGN